MVFAFRWGKKEWIIPWCKNSLSSLPSLWARRTVSMILQLYPSYLGHVHYRADSSKLFINFSCLWLQSSHFHLGKLTFHCVVHMYSVALVCLTLWPHGLSPARLFCPWDSPSKNTGVGCHFLLQGSSQSEDQTCVFCIGRGILYHWATWKAQCLINSS